MVSTAAFAADNQFERTLNVSAQPDLYVSTGSGDITIHAGSDNQIHIVGHVHAGWAIFGDVKTRIERIVDNPPIVQDGNTVRVGESNDHELFNNLSIDYDISAPAGVALNLHSGSGDVESTTTAVISPQRADPATCRAHGINGPPSWAPALATSSWTKTGAGDVKVKTGSGHH